MYAHLLSCSKKLATEDTEEEKQSIETVARKWPLFPGSETDRVAALPHQGRSEREGVAQGGMKGRARAGALRAARQVEKKK
jgi:hypothetical protein